MQKLILFLLLLGSIQVQSEKIHGIFDMNTEFGDSAPNEHKQLIITYKLNGKTEMASFEENERMRLGSTSHTRPIVRVISLPDEAEIISATYGSGNKRSDVTNIVKNFPFRDPNAPKEMIDPRHH